MQIVLDDNMAAAAHLTEDSALLLLAVALYAEKRLTLAQAARFCGLDRLSFQRELAERHTDLNYGAQGLEMDLATLDSRGVK